MLATELQQSSERKAEERRRVLVVSHMHARVSRGGGEIAAYQMYQELSRRPGYETFFLAGGAGKLHAPLGASIFQPFDEREYIAVASGYDHFSHSNPDVQFYEKLRALLTTLKPHVVHFHHYMNFGVELFRFVREHCPGVRILLTLHEYGAICHHFGQMVTRPNFRLCEAAAPRDCATCFPEIPEENFLIRNLYIRRFFAEVDTFVSPSRFLAERYIAWGLPRDRVVVVENGLPESAFANEPPPPVGRELVFGFFGQLSNLKGVRVVLDAADEIAAVASDLPVRVRIDIHGDASNQPKELQTSLLESSGASSRIVRHVGPYRHSEVARLMSGCHAVIVPSIWWENSPLVIQEALAARRPVICSALGGMAEKVRDGVDGFHFRAGNPSALAELLIELAREPERLRSVYATLAKPPSIVETVDRIVDLYGFAPAPRRKRR